MYGYERRESGRASRIFRIVRVVAMVVGAWWLAQHGVLMLKALWLRWRNPAPTIDVSRAWEHDKIIPLAVIGSGPAGLSAALYGARFNIHSVVFEGPVPGGQLTGTSDVENWPGIGRDVGTSIIDRLRRQAGQFGVLYSMAVVTNINLDSWPYALTLDDGTVTHALSIVLATGAAPRKLGVPGEETYFGRGVTSCATCDAPFFKGKNVFVVGGGDAAIEEALQLASYAHSITILVRGERMRASHAMQQRLKAYSHITVRYQTSISEIEGNGTHVTGATLVSGGKSEKAPIDGVFLAIGHIPNTKLVADRLELDEFGYVKLVKSHQQCTSMPGIFAAGDVSDHQYRQAGIASGDGIRAAIDAAHFLGKHGMDDAMWSKHEHQFYNPDENKVFEPLPKITTEDEFAKAITAEGAVIVEFSTPTCVSCAQVQKHLAASAAMYEGRARVIVVDGAALPGLLQRYEVSRVPTVLAMKGGLVIGRATTLESRRDVQAFVALYAEGK